MDAMIGEQSSRLEEIHAATATLLDCGEDYFLMKQAAERLYTLFSDLTGISVDDLGSGEIRLSSGKAISPGAAAHCLLEFKRTAVFLRGIRQAIEALLTEQREVPVRILYAGCGPYATLITPLLSLYTPRQLQADLLDINPVSLDAARKVIETFGLETYIGGYLLEDGATYVLPQGRRYHILLSETMQACLNHEPQVAILRNLLPQLPADCLLIPQEILIDARLTNPGQEQEKFFWSETPKPPPERIHLGEVFSLSRDCLDHEGAEVNIPERFGPCYHLQLFTRVRVFGDQLLDENDSSITLPKSFYDFRRSRYAERIRFFYDQAPGELPKMQCRVVEPCAEGCP